MEKIQLYFRENFEEDLEDGLLHNTLDFFSTGDENLPIFILTFIFFFLSRL